MSSAFSFGETAGKKGSVVDFVESIFEMTKTGFTFTDNFSILLVKISLYWK